MYIKKVIINNFKSYKEATLDNLNPGLNVIVGQNGSGKSNFLSAIQCVLSPESYSWRSDEKIQYINDEEEALESCATVEIIFNNTSRRIPVSKDEVSIKRTLSSKKDTFFVDGRSLTKQEMLNLLESMGFSKGNPYNIVKQGKVNQLAMSNDSQRYNLLIDIAGVKIYNEKREESLQLLTESNEKRIKIMEYIENINERLRLLESEKREMVEYNRKEKEKNKLEYVIYVRERNECMSRLEILNNEKESLLRELSLAQEKLFCQKNQFEANYIRTYNKKIQERSDIDKLMDDIFKKLKSFTESKSLLELEIHELKSTSNETNNYKSGYNEQLKNVELEINNKEFELKQLKKELNSNKSIELCVKDRIQSFTGYNYSQDIISQDTSLSKSLNQTTSNKINTFKTQQKELTNKLKNTEQKLHKSNILINQLKKKCFELIDQKKLLWQDEIEAAKAVRDTSEKLFAFEKKRNYVVPKDVINGLKSLQLIVSQNSLSGVYGALFENLHSDPRFFTAIDVTAGNKLFNVMVETSELATDILKKLKQNKFEGQLTFMPLNQLHVRTLENPNLDVRYFYFSSSSSLSKFCVMRGLKIHLRYS
ncbi:hypothetical protein HZS_105, partial [Henneguya salminicola]